ncbi:SRPBCC family protein [Kaarinaea lacus]
MIRVKGSVNIETRPDQVFALISDARKCAELNPRIEVIDISAEPADQLHEGTVFHNRVVVEGRMTEYTSKVVAFEPDHSLQIKTNTYPEVTITYQVAPVPGGSRLEQELISSVTREDPIPVNLPYWFAKLVDMFAKESHSPEERAALQRQEEAMMTEELQAQLDEWLAVVKKYLEEQRDKFLA